MSPMTAASPIGSARKTSASDLVPKMVVRRSNGVADMALHCHKEEIGAHAFPGRTWCRRRKSESLERRFTSSRKPIDEVAEVVSVDVFFFRELQPELNRRIVSCARTELS